MIWLVLSAFTLAPPSAGAGQKVSDLYDRVLLLRAQYGNCVTGNHLAPAQLVAADRATAVIKRQARAAGFGPIIGKADAHRARLINDVDTSCIVGPEENVAQVTRETGGELVSAQHKLARAIARLRRK